MFGSIEAVNQASTRKHFCPLHLGVSLSIGVFQHNDYQIELYYSSMQLVCTLLALLTYNNGFYFSLTGRTWWNWWNRSSWSKWTCGKDWVQLYLFNLMALILTWSNTCMWEARGIMVSAVDCTLDQVVWVCALLCSWERHATLTVPLSTHIRCLNG